MTHLNGAKFPDFVGQQLRYGLQNAIFRTAGLATYRKKSPLGALITPDPPLTLYFIYHQKH